MGLSGNYWPAHPKPQQDELFSCWLARTALSNAPTAHRFCQSIWPNQQVWTRDIDVCNNISLIPTLSARTGVPARDIYSMCLQFYEGTVVERLHVNTPTNWVLPTGVYHRIRTRYGLQWCPICLREDPVPYFRRQWRMAFCSCCPKHGILLADRCHKCRSPAVPFRSGITTCYKCASDLRDHPPCPALAEAIIAEDLLTKRAVDGRTLLPGYQPIFPISFFDIWHRLLSLVASGKRSTALRASIAKRFGGDPAPVKFDGKHEIELLPPSERNRLMDLTCRLWPGWPFRLIAVALESRNWASYILRDMHPVRYHLWEPMRHFLAGSPAHN